MARKPRPNRRKPPRSILRLIPRHGAFPLAIAAGLVAFGIALITVPAYALAIGANAVFAGHLLFVFLELPRLTPDYLKEHASEEDVPIALIFVVTLAIVAVGVVSLFLALDNRTASDPVEIILGVISVVLGWFVIHTMAALHYAYEYYDSPGASPARTSEIVGGLEWPENSDEPDGVAFIYIAYQIGSAGQISDARATSNKMRAMIAAHGVFSFFYNTLLVAAAVNVVLNAAGGN